MLYPLVLPLLLYSTESMMLLILIIIIQIVFVGGKKSFIIVVGIITFCYCIVLKFGKFKQFLLSVDAYKSYVGKIRF